MRSRVFAAAVAVPPVIVAIAWLGALAMTAVTGQHPIWNLRPRNLAEAAAFRDGAALVLGAERGDDLSRPGDVRPGIVSSERQRLTPIEAAALARRPEIVQILFDLGVKPDAKVWQRAWCISDEPVVRQLLDQRRPSGTAAACNLPDER